jgi:sarcosine oxidase
VTLETRTFEPDQAALKRVEIFVQHYLPEAFGPVIYTKTCLYTMPPDRDFVIDTLPGYPNCFIAIGAGHAFKFASVIGKRSVNWPLMALHQPILNPFASTAPS